MILFIDLGRERRRRAALASGDLNTNLKRNCSLYRSKEEAVEQQVVVNSIGYCTY